MPVHKPTSDPVLAITGDPIARPGLPWESQRSGGTVYLFDYADMTFTRSGEAAYADPRDGWSFAASGAAAWKGTDVPRIFSDGAILIEGARTNAITTSATAGPSGSATVTADVADAPDGATSEADRLESTGTALANRWRYYDLGTISASKFSLYVKDGGQGSYCDLDRGTSFNGAPTTPLPSTWTRLSTSDTTTRFHSACLGYHDGTQTGATGDKLLVWGWQSEVGTFATSPIRTSGASATRNAETCTTTIDAALAAKMERSGGFEFFFWPGWADTHTTAINPYVFDVGSGHLQLYRVGTSGKVFQLLGDLGGATTVPVTVTSGWNAGDKLRIRVEIPASGPHKLTIWNVTQGTGPYTASDATPFTLALSGKVLSIGKYGGGLLNNAFGVISRWWEA